MAFDEESTEPLTEFDTTNATKFHASEASPDQYAHYNELARYNTGLHQRNWSDQTELRRIDNLALYDAIVGQLELSPYQKSEGRAAFDRLSLRDFGFSAELIIFAVAAVVSRRDGRQYHPRRNPENNDTEFLRIANDFGWSTTHIERALLRVADEIEVYLG